MCRPFPLMPGPNHRVVQVKRQRMYGALQVRRRFDVNSAGKRFRGIRLPLNGALWFDEAARSHCNAINHE